MVTASEVLLQEDTWKWIGISLIIVIGSAVVINASLVCLFCWKGRYRKSYHQAYINLAVSDLVFSIWGACFTAPNYFYGREENDAMCRVIPIVASYLLTVNVVSVHPIAVDRLVAVYLPMRYKAGVRNRKYCILLKITMVLGWVLPAIYAIALSIAYHMEDTPQVAHIPHPTLPYHYCDFNPSSPLNHAFQLSRFLIFYCSAVSVDIIIYLLIVWRVSRGKPGREMRNTNNLVVIIRAGLVCLVILTSWTPFMIIVLVPGLTVNVKIIGYAVYYLGCLVNPFLYVVSSRAIRASLRRLTKKTRDSVRRLSRNGMRRNSMSNAVAETDIGPI